MLGHPLQPCSCPHSKASSQHAGQAEAFTMFESFLVQVSVRGGFPTHTQVRVTSEPMSVVVGLGSTTIRGATERERNMWSTSPALAVHLFPEPFSSIFLPSHLHSPSLTTSGSVDPPSAYSQWLCHLCPCPLRDSQWTFTKVLTLVLPTLLWTSQDTGSVKNE